MNANLQPQDISSPRIRSCTLCRTRRIRCDKVRPTCGGCSKSGVPCEFPTHVRKAVPRPRKDAVLLQRLQRLESVIEELSKVTGKGSHEEPRSDDIEVQAQEMVTGLGKLVVSDGRSRYIGPFFWGSLSDEVADLKSLLEEPISSPTTPATPLSAFDEPSSFLFRPSVEDLSGLHPTPSESTHLYTLFCTCVDPLVRILHKPTFEAKLRHFYASGEADRPFEALLFAVYFSTVASLREEDVPAMFGVEKNVLWKRYSFAVEQALANARLLQSEELTTLQAFVLFLSCSKSEGETRKAWLLVGLATRMAESMGLHRDGTLFDIPPLETELRRRLWHEICMLDLRAAEDHGSDPSISTQSYDTRLPLNVEDSDLVPGDVPWPVERKEFTEMTFCLMRFEALGCFRQAMRSIPGAAKVEKGMEQQLTLEEKEARLRELEVRLHEKYLKGVDLEQPIQRVAYMASKVIVGKALLSLYHPLRHFKQGELLSQEKKDKLFLTAIECLETFYWFRNNPTSPRYSQWTWLLQRYNRARATALVLSELVVRPAAGVDPLVERAWLTMEGLWTNCDEERVWKPLEKLKEKVLNRRIKAMRMREVEDAATSFTPPAPPLPSTPPPSIQFPHHLHPPRLLGEEYKVDAQDIAAEEVQFDWTEWDEMFQTIGTDY